MKPEAFSFVFQREVIHFSGLQSVGPRKYTLVYIPILLYRILPRCMRLSP